MDDHSSVVGLGPSVLVASSHQILLAPRVQMLKWKLRESQNPPRVVGTELSPRSEQFISPSHSTSPASGLLRGLLLLPPGALCLCVLEGLSVWAWFVLDAVMCLPPSPPTCPEVKGFVMSSWQDGESQGEKDFVGILFPLKFRFNKSGAGGEGYHATCQLHRHNLEYSSDTSGQWERALSPLLPRSQGW